MIDRKIFTCFLVLVLSVMALMPFRLTAQEASPYPVLMDYLEQASEQNSELQAIYHQYLAEQEMAKQAGTLPDPEINIGYFMNPMQSESVLGQFSISAMQMFPWFGSLDARKNIQQSRAEATRETLRGRQLELFRDMQNVWLDLSEIHREIAIVENHIELVRDLEFLVEARYETATSGQVDVLRIQMEEQRLKTRIANLEDKLKPLTAQFNAYLNRDKNTPVETAEDLDVRLLPWKEEKLHEMIRAQNPAFAQLDAQDSALRYQQEQATRDGRPSIGLGVEVMGRDFGVMSMNPDMKEGFVGMATIRVPLNRSRYKAQHREAIEQRQSLDHRRTELDNQLTTQLEQALELYRQTERNLLLLDEELIPRAEHALELLMESYSTGGVRFDELLQLRRELLDYELERITTLIAQHKAVVRIESLY